MNKVPIPNGVEATIAIYRDQKLREYNANPMIQALPLIMSDQEFLQSATIMPDFSPEERMFEPHLRFHCVERLSRYFDPIDKTLELQRIVSVLLRQGYIARNILQPQYARRANQIYEAIKTGSGKTIENYVDVPTSASGFTLIGPSGMGKTTNLKNILSLYPQVIAHPQHNAYQLVWIKVDCPHAGSLKGLCIDIFKEVDRLLGTNYFKKFGSTRNSEDYMLAQVAQLAHTHHLGMLVIDEMQNLVNARRTKDDLLNFLVKMDNIIGVPVIRVGTNEAYPILQGNFRNARRGTGEGGVLWDRMKQEDEDEWSEWQFFVEGMWKYQWTTEYTVLTDEIYEALYFETQGIIDLVVKLFKMVQWRAIAQGGDEIVTVELIHEVAKEGLYLVKPMLDAIRSGDTEWMNKYKDIAPLSTVEYQTKYASKLESKDLKEIPRLARKQQEQKSPILSTVILQLIQELDVEPLFAKQCAEKVFNPKDKNHNISSLVKQAYALVLQGGGATTTTNIKETQSKKTNKVKLEPQYQENDMRLIVAEAQKKGISAHDALKQAGFIRNPIDDFINVG
ncbi:MAG: ATP-binding protein [Xenococcaceae cyanobacterium MO_167.B27]|nr:ATP-binding protein [Xenococcaceae cyanobacterium MO_167.B27]